MNRLIILTIGILTVVNTHASDQGSAYGGEDSVKITNDSKKSISISVFHPWSIGSSRRYPLASGATHEIPVDLPRNEMRDKAALNILIFGEYLEDPENTIKPGAHYKIIEENGKWVFKKVENVPEPK